MKTTSIIFIFFLTANLCFGQTQSVPSGQKNKIILKITSLQKENDASSVDRILNQCAHIYSSKTDFTTGICEVVADSNVTIETINKSLSIIGQTAELVSIRTMTKEEFIKEGIIENKNTNKQKKQSN